MPFSYAGSYNIPKVSIPFRGVDLVRGSEAIANSGTQITDAITALGRGINSNKFRHGLDTLQSGSAPVTGEDIMKLRAKYGNLDEAGAKLYDTGLSEAQNRFSNKIKTDTLAESRMSNKRAHDARMAQYGVTNKRADIAAARQKKIDDKSNALEATNKAYKTAYNEQIAGIPTDMDPLEAAAKKMEIRQTLAGLFPGSAYSATGIDQATNAYNFAVTNGARMDADELKAATDAIEKMEDEGILSTEVITTDDNGLELPKTPTEISDTRDKLQRAKKEAVDNQYVAVSKNDDAMVAAANTLVQADSDIIKYTKLTPAQARSEQNKSIGIANKNYDAGGTMEDKLADIAKADAMYAHRKGQRTNIQKPNKVWETIKYMANPFNVPDRPTITSPTAEDPMGNFFSGETTRRAMAGSAADFDAVNVEARARETTRRANLKKAKAAKASSTRLINEIRDKDSSANLTAKAKVLEEATDTFTDKYISTLTPKEAKKATLTKMNEVKKTLKGKTKEVYTDKVKAALKVYEDNVKAGANKIVELNDLKRKEELLASISVKEEHAKDLNKAKVERAFPTIKDNLKTPSAQRKYALEHDGVLPTIYNKAVAVIANDDSTEEAKQEARRVIRKHNGY